MDTPSPTTSVTDASSSPHRGEPTIPPILLPPDDEGLELLHTRTYEVQVFKASATEMVARGAVRDLKPGGLYLPDDPVALPVHHMVVELRVAFPSLEITAASVEFRVYPEDPCPSITTHYENLVGLSIARGFTHKVRELFGGPRGCTHTTALLQAMAPAVVQSTYSMRVLAMKAAGRAGQLMPKAPPGLPLEERRKMYGFNLNTCHMWAEDGPFVAALDRGEQPSTPVFIRQRFAERGIDPGDWRRPTPQGG